MPEKALSHTDLSAVLRVDGVVLDPFAGSGSTGQAAMFEGFRFIGIEQDAGHVELARHRVGLAARNGWQPGLELEAAA